MNEEPVFPQFNTVPILCESNVAVCYWLARIYSAFQCLFLKKLFNFIAKVSQGCNCYLDVRPLSTDLRRYPANESWVIVCHAKIGHRQGPLSEEGFKFWSKN